MSNSLSAQRRLVGARIAGIIAAVILILACHPEDAVVERRISASPVMDRTLDNIEVYDLAAFGGVGTGWLAVNNRGMVVGAAPLTSSFYPHPFLWSSNDGIQDLGTFGGNGSVARDINAAGQITGVAATADNPSGHAFLWTRQLGLTDLGALGDGSSWSSGRVINDVGQVAGEASAGTTEQHAFLWTATAGMQDLGTLGGTSASVIGIDNAGDVAGNSFTPGDLEQHAFVWLQALGMQDLTLGGRQAFAIAMNVKTGAIVGSSCTVMCLASHAFLWTREHGLEDLGTLPGNGCCSEARAVNDAGQVVGWSTTAEDPTGRPHPFVWTREHGMQMLPTFGAKGEALGINNAGRIVGFAIKMTDRTEIHAVLWTRDGEMVDLYPATGFHEAKEITDDGWILFDQSGVARLRGNPE